jgi:C1A family cysteine protease
MYCLYDDVVLPQTCEVVGTGWLPPLPDLRDFTPETPRIAEMSEQLGVTGAGAAEGFAAPPPTVDLRPWCSPIENQGSLGSCTANAAVGVVEYFQRRAYSKFIDGSRLFVYKTTRDLLGVTGDTGAWLRNTMGALATCGVPPEKYWPYVIADFDKEPTAFVYSIADNFEAVSYFSHDPLGANVPPPTVLSSVKTYLAAGIPSMFGFWGFPSFNNTDVPGGIPYPCPGEAAQWGHAIVAVGYDDNKKITNTLCNKTTTGAFLIRNSWGTAWGAAGYGWIPYDYVLNKIALDFWSLINMKWVQTGQFGL